MAAGGIYDHVGGGFHRYSVDDHWLVPHFEKMLYDQALLVARVPARMLVTGHRRYRRVVEETIDYVLRDLRHADGGFFSAEDADSEGVEGKFYLWSLDEIEELGGDDAARAGPVLRRHRRRQLQDPHTGFRGNILHAVDRDRGPPRRGRPGSPGAVRRARAARPSRARRQGAARVERALPALAAEAAAALERDDWMDAARAQCAVPPPRAAARRRPAAPVLAGRAGPTCAYAEDYAALLGALLTLAELDDVALARGGARRRRRAAPRCSPTRSAAGSSRPAPTPKRSSCGPKDFQDNATPSENSLAADGLLRLAALTGDADAAEPAERWVATLAPVLGEHPTAFAFLLGALGRLVRPPLEVAIVGDPDDPTRGHWSTCSAGVLAASVRVTAAPGTGAELTPLLADRAERDGRATAYVCQRFACQLPVTDADALRAQLDDVSATRR